MHRHLLVARDRRSILLFTSVDSNVVMSRVAITNIDEADFGLS